MGVRASATAAAVARLIDLDSHAARLCIAGIIGKSDRNGIASDRGSIDLAVYSDIDISIAVVNLADMLLDIEFIADLNAH